MAADTMLTVLMRVPVSHQNAEVFLKVHLNTMVTRRVTKRDPVYFRQTAPLTGKPDVCHADSVLLK